MTPELLQSSSILAVIIWPLIVALVVSLAGRRSPGAARRAALNGALLHVGLMVVFCTAFYSALAYDRFGVAASFQPLGVPGAPRHGGADMHSTAWDLLTFPVAGVTYAEAAGRPRTAAVQLYLGVDGLNIWLVALAGVMNLVAVAASWRAIRDRAHAYYAWLFVLLAAVTGAFLSFDAVLFYTFFELTLIPAFFLIGHWGVGGGRRDAARKFFLYTFFGSILTLTGILGIALTNPTPLYRSGQVMERVNATGADKVAEVPASGPVTFSIPQLMRNVQVWGWVREQRANSFELARQVALAERDQFQDSLGAAADDSVRRAALAASESKCARLAGEAASAEREASSRRRVQTALFFLLMCGFAVKIPIVPFHTWLPAAYSEAPLPVAMMFSATLAKLGTFGVMRLVLPLAPGPAAMYGLPVFGTLGAIGIVYGALCAFAQRDVKRVIAYSSISHLGLVVIALFAGTSEAYAGASLHMVNHGLSTGVLFALLGFLHDRYKTTDGTQFSGLFGRFPAFGLLFMVAALASVGVPAFNNFVSEMLMLAGLFRPEVTVPFGYGYAVAGAAGIFLSAWYTMTLVRRVFFGPPREPVTTEPVPVDPTTAEWLAFCLPLVFCLVLGVCPQPALDAIGPDATTLESQARNARQQTLIEPPE